MKAWPWVLQQYGTCCMIRCNLSSTIIQNTIYFKKFWICVQYIIKHSILEGPNIRFTCNGLWKWVYFLKTIWDVKHAILHVNRENLTAFNKSKKFCYIKAIRLMRCTEFSTSVVRIQLKFRTIWAMTTRWQVTFNELL